MTDGDLHWVFGLSIDEELTWAVAQVDYEAAKGIKAYREDAEFYYGKIADIPTASARNPNDKKFPLRQAIIDGLNGAKKADKNLSNIFDMVEAIGVSTIGLANYEKRQLINIERKKFTEERPGDYYLDFNLLFPPVFPKAFPGGKKPIPISVRNDVTAKCLAQYCWKDHDNDIIMCYINVNVGVNIGLCNKYGPLSVVHLHPEAGHIYPRLHPDDELNRASLEDVSGCPAHIYCFEGVASGERIRKDWVIPLHDLSLHPKAWDVISFYVGQLCWNACLAAAPGKIVIGGPVIPAELLGSIHDQFDGFNRGKRDGESKDVWVERPRYLRYKELDDLEQFIGMAKPIPITVDRTRIKEIDGLMGSLELARLALRRSRR